MASRVTLMTALFDQFTSFVSELSEMYPEDPDFSMFLTTVRLLVRSWFRPPHKLHAQILGQGPVSVAYLNCLVLHISNPK